MATADLAAPAASFVQRSGWLAFAVLLGVLIAAAYPSLEKMVLQVWFGAEEYSHAALIPLLAAYLVRQRAKTFVDALDAGSCILGVVVAALGCSLILIGSLSAIPIVEQYGFLIGVFGLVGATFGSGVLQRLFWPLAILVFMIPLPNFVYQPLSSQLQLMSSELGVALLRACGVSVYLHGNVIDLGVYQLQVLEACNGLRYLFPLASLGYLFGYLFRGPLWQRLILVVASAPITLLLNGLRIGAIGITVDHWGVAAAEGVLHQFEGWVIFFVCVALLLGTAKLLAIARGARGPLIAQFALALDPAPAAFRHPPIRSPAAFGATLAVLLIAVTLAHNPQTADTRSVDARRSFAEFPMQFADWRGTRDTLDADVLRSLASDDYLMADYADGAGHQVNFYSAFYDSQLGGRSAHSPRSCLPGDGWRITSFSTIELTDPLSGRGVPVNRVVIARGSDTQLVYYWFEQRGRVLNNEYLVKWYILRDSLVRHRTDGALVRLTTPVRVDGDLASADAILANFFARTRRLLPQFIPG